MKRRGGGGGGRCVTERAREGKGGKERKVDANQKEHAFYYLIAKNVFFKFLNTRGERMYLIQGKR
jgi:hypothetical protein